MHWLFTCCSFGNQRILGNSLKIVKSSSKRVRRMTIYFIAALNCCVIEWDFVSSNRNAFNEIVSRFNWKDRFVAKDLLLCHMHYECTHFAHSIIVFIHSILHLRHGRGFVFIIFSSMVCILTRIKCTRGLCDLSFSFAQGIRSIGKLQGDIQWHFLANLLRPQLLQMFSFNFQISSLDHAGFSFALLKILKRIWPHSIWPSIRRRTLAQNWCKAFGPWRRFIRMPNSENWFTILIIKHALHSSYFVDVLRSLITSMSIHFLHFSRGLWWAQQAFLWQYNFF